jgi:hypothetical protein
MTRATARHVPSMTASPSRRQHHLGLFMARRIHRSIVTGEHPPQDARAGPEKAAGSFWCSFATKLRQLRDVDGDAPRLVTGEEVRGRAPSRLLLEVDVGERLPVGVADNEADVGLLDGPGRRKAAPSTILLFELEFFTRQ